MSLMLVWELSTGFYLWRKQNRIKIWSLKFSYNFICVMFILLEIPCRYSQFNVPSLFRYFKALKHLSNFKSLIYCNCCCTFLSSVCSMMSSVYNRKTFSYWHYCCCQGMQNILKTFLEQCVLAYVGHFFFYTFIVL